MANDNYITGVRGFTADNVALADGYQGQNGQMAGGGNFAFGALFSPIEETEIATVWANVDLAGFRGWRLAVDWTPTTAPALLINVGGGATLDAFSLPLLAGAGAAVHAVVRVTGATVRVYVAGTRCHQFVITDPSAVASPKAPTVGFADSAVPTESANGTIIHGMWYDAVLTTDGQIAEHFRRCTAAFDIAARANFFLPATPDFANRFSARDVVQPGVRAVPPLFLPPPAPIWVPRAGNISLTRRDSGFVPPPFGGTTLGTLSMKNPMWASGPTPPELP